MNELGALPRVVQLLKASNGHYSSIKKQPTTRGVCLFFKLYALWNDKGVEFCLNKVLASSDVPRPDVYNLTLHCRVRLSGFYPKKTKMSFLFLTISGGKNKDIFFSFFFAMEKRDLTKNTIKLRNF